MEKTLGLISLQQRWVPLEEGGMSGVGMKTDDEQVLGGYIRTLVLIGGGILEIIAVFAFSAAQLRRRMRDAILQRMRV